MSEPPDPGTRDERVVILLESPPRELDPRLVSDSSSTKVSRLIFCSLATIETDDLVPRPEAAASIRPACPDTVRDCASWVVTMRHDVYWHDGVHVSAADVEYTYRSILESDLPSPFKGALRRKIRSVTASGDTVRFDLVRPVASFPVDLSLGLVPAHVLGPRGGLSGRFDEDFLGCGPFKFLFRYRDQKVVLQRNDAYFAPVGPEYVVVRTVPDESTRVLSLAAGSGQIAVNLLSPPLVQYMEERDDVSVEHRASAGVTYLAFNLLDERLADPRVRRGIALSLDREEIVRQQFRGMAQVASSVLPPMHWAADPDLDPLPFDPAEAASLLAAAGLGPSAPQERRHFVLKCTTDRFRRSVADIMAHQMEAVGLDVQVLPLEISTFLEDVRKGSFEMYSLQAPEALDPDILRWFFHSQAAPTLGPQPGKSRYGQVDRTLSPPHFEEVGGPFAALCRQAWFPMVEQQAAANAAALEAGQSTGIGNGNRSFFFDPTLDCLLDLACTTMEPTTRLALYREAQRMIAEAVPVLPLWHEDNVAVVRGEVAGYSLLPINRLSPVTGVRIVR
jgi:peptide/nickel transport system substrate-binding protein